MLSPEQAYAAYLQLDGPRTLEGLRQKLAEDGEEVPTLRWCQKWSARDKWRDRAKEHDRQVELRASEKIVEAKAETRVELYEASERAALAAFECVGKLLDGYTPQDVSEAEKITAMGICMAEATVGLKREGLSGGLPIIEGPFTAAQIAGDGDGIFELVKDHFLPPPESA